MYIQTDRQADVAFYEYKPILFKYGICIWHAVINERKMAVNKNV